MSARPRSRHLLGLRTLMKSTARGLRDGLCMRFHWFIGWDLQHICSPYATGSLLEAMVSDSFPGPKSDVFWFIHDARPLRMPQVAGKVWTTQRLLVGKVWPHPPFASCHTAPMRCFETQHFQQDGLKQDSFSQNLQLRAFFLQGKNTGFEACSWNVGFFLKKPRFFCSEKFSWNLRPMRAKFSEQCRLFSLLKRGENPTLWK